MEPVKNITPIQAAELTREHFRWKEHVQHQLDQYVPIYCEKGERSGRVYIKVTVDITPADCIRIVSHILDDLGWKPTDPEYNQVNYPQPKGCELRVFASTEPLVPTQQNREA